MKNFDKDPNPMLFTVKQVAEMLNSKVKIIEARQEYKWLALKLDTENCATTIKIRNF